MIKTLRDIADKVEDGERLTFDEGMSLYATDDLNALGKLADHRPPQKARADDVLQRQPAF